MTDLIWALITGFLLALSMPLLEVWPFLPVVILVAATVAWTVQENAVEKTND